MSDGWSGPVPQPTLDSQPHWEGLREHRLLLQRCARCHRLRHYPRPVCPHCYSLEDDWIEATGRGVVHSWTISHHPFHPAFKELVPYSLVTVDLDEGVRMQSRLVDSTEPTLGMPVQVAFEDLDASTTVAVFHWRNEA